jgi:DNA-directed RNA polymerase sigma subunit (sigma70/sigma32)
VTGDARVDRSTSFVVGHRGVHEQGRDGVDSYALLDEHRGFEALTRCVQEGGVGYEQAFQELCTRTQALCCSLAQKYHAAGRVGLDDLLQAGTIGVLQAAQYFDPEAGKSFPASV